MDESPASEASSTTDEFFNQTFAECLNSEMSVDRCGTEAKSEAPFNFEKNLLSDSSSQDEPSFSSNSKSQGQTQILFSEEPVAMPAAPKIPFKNPAGLASAPPGGKPFTYMTDVNVPVFTPSVAPRT